MIRDINKLHPAVARMYRALDAAVKERGLRMIATCTLRTAEEQAALRAQGREHVTDVNTLRVAAGMAPIKEGQNKIVTMVVISKHQFGCAFDIALLDEGQQPHWSMHKDINMNDIIDYIEVGNLGEALGLVWGGRFQKRDYCHFEYTGGLSIEQLKQGIRPAEKTELKENAMKINLKELLPLVGKTLVGMSVKKDIAAKGEEVKQPVWMHKRIFGIIGTALFGGLAASAGVDITVLLSGIQALFDVAMENKEQTGAVCGMVYTMGLTLWGHIRRKK